MLTDKDKALQAWPDAYERTEYDGKIRIVIPLRPDKLMYRAVSEAFVNPGDAWKSAAANAAAAAAEAAAQKRLSHINPEAIYRKERIDVYVRNNHFVVLLKEGQPTGILIPGHAEDEAWGDALLTEAERQEIYAAALDRLSHGIQCICGTDANELRGMDCPVHPRGGPKW